MCKKVDVPLSYTFHEVNKLFINNVKNESEMLGINPSYRYVFMALKNNEMVYHNLKFVRLYTLRNLQFHYFYNKWKMKN